MTGDTPTSHTRRSAKKEISTSKSKRMTVATFTVSSRVLIEFSSFFATILSEESQFSEAVSFRAPTAQNVAAPFPLTIDIEDMTLFCVEVVLNLMHGQSHGYYGPNRTRSAKKLKENFEKYFQIAELVEYLDCCELVHDWGQIWLDKSPNLYIEVGDSNTIDKLIFVSDVFQKVLLFHSATQYALAHVVLKRRS
ncbi:hypothetical protein EX30DRAFT_30508 [Ascodesmis nigricans]|uniref:BTB domain-containing protein n=1 Tax=Ascodesmis nigricans TaxID=341454 RepID=A0A4S2N8K5_9PEZI|nr:hypothetical protein EX30DRAFT_30508 [Ascodesmis nigricans]